MSKGRFEVKCGTLALFSNYRSYPTVSRREIPSVRWNGETLECYVLSDTDVSDPKAWSKMALYHVSHFYEYNVPMTSEDNITSKKLCRSFIGMLALLGTPSKIASDDNLYKALTSAGMRIDFRMIGPEEIELAQSHHYDGFKTDLEREGDWDKLIEDPGGVLTIVAVIALAMIKYISADNASGWIDNRIRTFCGSIGEDKWKSVWESMKPDTGYLKKFHSFMSSNFNVRKEAFIILNSICKADSNDIITVVCRDIVQLMRGAEMHHLVLIDLYIMRRYPELLSYHGLRDLKDQFNKVIDRLKREDKSDIFFVKLLNNKDDTAELNRQNFKQAAIIATACARFESPTFDNYFMDTSEQAQELAERVTKYLHFRRDLTLHRLGESDFNDMKEKESKLFFEKALAEYMKTTDDGERPGSPTNLRKVFTP